jgi:aspartyl-tRNA(Asn)/glutamyl-tRNA(Gln) amidotransferase subunit A
MRTRRLIQQDFDAAFAAADVIVTPATPSAAPDVTTFFDDGDRLWLDKVARNFLMFNVTGMPALVLPSGFDDGLPVAIQIAARPHRDELCLRVGHAFQLATDHHLRRPSP